jgi:hypothetical protein
MNELKIHADEEQQHFESQWYTLARNIENDRKYKDFVSPVITAGNGTIINNSMNLSSQKLDGTVSNLMNNNDLESILRQKVTKGAWNIAKDKANIHLSMEKVQAYEEVSIAAQYSPIRYCTGTTATVLCIMPYDI